MIKLIYETPESHKEFTGMHSCEIEIQDEASLEEMLDSYAAFLRAIGYQIPIGAYVQITEDEV
jgi:hypothetical protein